LERYHAFPKVTEIFPLYGVGMTTASDNYDIDFDQNVLVNRIRLFKHNPGSDDELHLLFQIREKKGWSIRRAWQMLQSVSDSELKRLTVPVLYRPFDVRWIFYHDSVVWRTVKRVMLHMLAGENLALIIPRRVEHIGDWHHAFVSKSISEHVAVSLKTTDYHCPLYIYPDPERGNLFSAIEPQERQPNLNPELFNALGEAYGQQPAPEQVFHYIYAVLYAPSYRERYSDFLRLDFPRIPFSAKREVFEALADLGRRLVALHLLESPELDPPLAHFEGEGDNRVAKNKRDGFYYEADRDRVYTNKSQYFAPVPIEAWKYPIGGYQVCGKWLKDRRGRQLSLDEIRTYCRIVTALARTMELQEEIDELYSRVEGDLLGGVST